MNSTLSQSQLKRARWAGLWCEIQMAWIATSLWATGLFLMAHQSETVQICLAVVLLRGKCVESTRSRTYIFFQTPRSCMAGRHFWIPLQSVELMAAWCKTRVVLHAGQPSESEHRFHASVSKDITLRFGLAGLALCPLPQYDRVSWINWYRKALNLGFIEPPVGAIASWDMASRDNICSACVNCSVRINNFSPGFGGPKPAQKRIHAALVWIRSLCCIGGCKDHPDRYGFRPMVAMVREAQKGWIEIS